MKTRQLNKYKLLFIIIVYLISINSLAYGQENIVVTLGNDLNQQQREEMLNLFGVTEGNIKVLVVTNEEERNYLKGIATEAQIGTRSISSAYVENLSRGEGINVETYNITWVTAEMFQNALATAGVTDARIIAAAPFNVSGTAALTGILKAFEEMRGETINEDRKRIANEEIVKTGELGEEIGQERAVQLIKEVKEEIIEKGVKNPEEIKRIVIEIAGRLDINLNTQQIEDISKLMEQISRLNLNTDVIRQQLQGIGQQLGEIAKQNEEVKSLLDRIIEMFRRLLESIFNMIGR
ncbi:DUF1002 domain-containing protein [Alkaliphilus transvaalensis]|uniref:DUF1002 domain-containing protein n=1 Tax=Alkaliphilus transvaalensis TaxID=114628 RepID=UPI000550759C|nr:DUF1002 domain-containing protein [Alkaliphilus transvaalensis]